MEPQRVHFFLRIPQLPVGLIQLILQLPEPCFIVSLHLTHLLLQLRLLALPVLLDRSLSLLELIFFIQ